MIRQINAAGLEIIESSEQLRLAGYLPTLNDKPTAGWGHTGPDVRVGETYPMSQCLAWLHQDLGWAENVVSLHAKGPLNDNQFSALVSLCFNIGSGNFDSSTLLKDLNAADLDDAANQFLVWDKQRGKGLPGLDIRRARERALFLTPVDNTGA